MSIQLQNVLQNGTQPADAMTIPAALGLAVLIEAQRLESARRELANIRADGVRVGISPRDLLRLENCGYILDFDAGVVVREVGG